MDRFECADIVSDQYSDWLVRATDFLQLLVAYSPSQKPASFTVDQVRKSVDEQIERLGKQGASRASRDSAPPH
jgi:arylsulfatase